VTEPFIECGFSQRWNVRSTLFYKLELFSCTHKHDFKDNIFLTHCSCWWVWCCWNIRRFTREEAIHEHVFIYDCLQKWCTWLKTIQIVSKQRRVEYSKHALCLKTKTDKYLFSARNDKLWRKQQWVVFVSETTRKSDLNITPVAIITIKIYCKSRKTGVLTISKEIEECKSKHAKTKTTQHLSDASNKLTAKSARNVAFYDVFEYSWFVNVWQ